MQLFYIMVQIFMINSLKNITVTVNPTILANDTVLMYIWMARYLLQNSWIKPEKH